MESTPILPTTSTSTCFARSNPLHLTQHKSSLQTVPAFTYVTKRSSCSLAYSNRLTCTCFALTSPWSISMHVYNFNFTHVRHVVIIVVFYERHLCVLYVHTSCLLESHARALVHRPATLFLALSPHNPRRTIHPRQRLHPRRTLTRTIRADTSRLSPSTAERGVPHLRTRTSKRGARTH